MSHEEMLSAGGAAIESVDAPIVRAHADSRHPAPNALTLPELGPAKWGMLAFLLSEVALFSTLIVVYVSYIGQDVVGPTPAEALSLPLVIATTICLLSSSATIHVAEHSLRLGDQKRFLQWWGATIALGVIFLLGTIYEWRELIVEHHLTISRNLFGTTYYTLVGFHGFHVSGGIVAMLGIAILTLTRKIRVQDRLGVELVSWYWHFVDAVWVVVFTVVYILGR